MFKITNTEIARVVQNAKGYVYDFGGRRFFVTRVCQSDGCGFDFCAGLSRTCLELVQQKVVGMLATADEFENLKLIDTRFAPAGQVLLIQENGEVVFNGVLQEDCLVVKLEGSPTTRLKMIPGRLYAVGTNEDSNNGLLVQAVSADHARDMFGKLHDLRCSLTAKLLVEGAIDKKVGPSTGRLERPSQEPRLNPRLGTVLVEHGDAADPLPHEVRGMSEKEQEEVVEKGISGSATDSAIEGEREYAESEILAFEAELSAGADLLDRFGAQLAESVDSGTNISDAITQGALDAIGRFESAKAVFGIPATPTPARPANVDDLTYAVTLVNHADSQVEGMRRKVVFTSSASDRENGGSSPCAPAPTSWICAGLSNPTASFGGNRVSAGDVREAVGNAARTVSGRTEDLLGLTRQSRLTADDVVNAHRVWFRLEAYRQRMAELEPVFRMNRSALDDLTGDALADVGAKIGAATAELYLALRVSGAETSFGRTTLEASEQGKLYQALNAHPHMLDRISEATAGFMGHEPTAVPTPAGSEDSSPETLASLGFGVPTPHLDAIEEEFASSLGVDGFDPDIGVVPADAQETMEAKLSAMFGASPTTGATHESLMDVAERSALYEDGRVNSPERFV